MHQLELKEINGEWKKKHKINEIEGWGIKDQEFCNRSVAIIIETEKHKKRWIINII